jgi:hypothetical protein
MNERPGYEENYNMLSSQKFVREEHLMCFMKGTDTVRI